MTIKTRGTLLSLVRRIGRDCFIGLANRNASCCGSGRNIDSALWITKEDLTARMTGTDGFKVGIDFRGGRVSYRFI